MNSSEKFETSGFNDRIKNLFTLAVFTILALIASIIVMDAVITPLAVFAVDNTTAFNYVIKIVFLLSFIVMIVFMIMRRILNLRRDGLSAGQISLYLLKRPGHYAGMFFIFLIISSAVIFIIYILLSYNYYMLYRVTGA